jgi:hypothetical protein
MLRIFIHDQVPMTSFVLQGKLIGPWVKELEKYWDWAQGDACFQTDVGGSGRRQFHRF